MGQNRNVKKEQMEVKIFHFIFINSMRKVIINSFYSSFILIAIFDNLIFGLRVSFPFDNFYFQQIVKL